MVQKNVGMRPSEEAGNTHPGEWLPGSEVVPPMSYNDLPVPDEIEDLFESEPPLAIPRSDLGGRLGINERSNALKTTTSNRDAQEMSLVLVGRTMGEGGVSPAQALVTMPLVSQEKYVIFSLAGAKYAVPMSQILEINELTNFTSVPNVPEWILGITSLRGDIMSIVDIRALFSMDPEDYADARSLLVAHTFEGDMTACLVVEQVIGVADIAASQIQPIDTVVEDRIAPYVRGVHVHREGLLSVLNLEGLLQSLDIAHFRP